MAFFLFFVPMQRAQILYPATTTFLPASVLGKRLLNVTKIVTHGNMVMGAPQFLHRQVRGKSKIREVSFFSVCYSDQAKCFIGQTPAQIVRLGQTKESSFSSKTMRSFW
jgi:hypothetical protein